MFLQKNVLFLLQIRKIQINESIEKYFKHMLSDWLQHYNIFLRDIFRNFDRFQNKSSTTCVYG